MTVLLQIAEASATALTLRATAKVVRAEQGALRFRLIRAADALDGMAQLALSLIDRVAKLEHELRMLKGGAQ